MKFKQNIKKAMNRVIALAGALALTVGVLAAPTYAAGVDADGYTMITTAAELDAMRNKTSGKYRLYADIDLKGYVSGKTTAANGWYPIGYGSPYFTGELDGNGYTIKGLWSGKGHGISYKGLFSVTMGATIKNLNIELADAGITGGYEVGAITGDARNGTVIENCHVSGGQIIVTGGGYAGGLVGNAYGSPAVRITNCTVTDTYTKTSGNYSGGLIGIAQNAVLTDCKAINTESHGTSYVGGFAGALKSQSKAVNCVSTGSATATASYAGGFAGVIYEASSIDGGYVSGDVSVKTSYAGGLVGAVYGKSSIRNGCARGNVNASYYAGGLIGTIYENSTVFRSCAYGDVKTKNYIAGGLVGEAVASTLSNTYARGNVSGTTGVGGLVGYFSGAGSTRNKSVENSYSSGTVTGKSGPEYGAFSGHSGVEFKGTNYYDQQKAGVNNAYGTAGYPVGSASAFPQARTTDKMMQQATFVGWDFNTIWNIDENETYPYFDCDGLNPNPKADVEFDIDGQLKVNRFVSIEAFIEASRVSNIVMTISPTDPRVPATVVMIDPVTATDTYKEMIFKQAGEYVVTVTADYAGGQLTESEVFTIEEDLAPVAGLELASLSYWNPYDGYATVSFNENAYSPDNDDISVRYMLWYDANWDGEFTDDECQIRTSITELSNIGNYKVCLVVTENYTNTIEKFITSEDYLSTQSDPIFFAVEM